MDVTKTHYPSKAFKLETQAGRNTSPIADNWPCPSCECNFAPASARVGAQFLRFAFELPTTKWRALEWPRHTLHLERANEESKMCVLLYIYIPIDVTNMSSRMPSTRMTGLWERSNRNNIRRGPTYNCVNNAILARHKGLQSLWEKDSAKWNEPSPGPNAKEHVCCPQAWDTEVLFGLWTLSPTFPSVSEITRSLTANTATSVSVFLKHPLILFNNAFSPLLLRSFPFV